MDIDDQRRYLRSVADAHEFTVVAAEASRLRATLRVVTPGGMIQIEEGQEP